MILKADEIARRLRAKGQERLVLVPEIGLANLASNGSASVDLRLGTWFLTLRQSKASDLDVYDPTATDIAPGQLTRSRYIPFGKEFVLHPRAFVLGVTLEWIRMPRNAAGYVVGKSSWGRRGLIIATAVGVHPGFVGCLTLELTNVGELPIRIKPGMAICQLCLHEARTNDTGADNSRFLGWRKPLLGQIEEDEYAKKLSRGL